MAIGELPHYVRVYDNHLDSELCRRMLASFEGLARFHVINGRGVRAGDDAQGAAHRLSAT